MLTNADSEAKDYLEAKKEVDDVYEGEYEPTAVNLEYRVKTHLLFDVVERSIALLMPGPYFEFVVEAANTQETADVISSEVAKALLEYTFNKKGGSATIREALTDMFLGNRGYVRTGFRPSIKRKGGKFSQMFKGKKTSLNVVESDGENKSDGQSYLERIKPKDFRIAKGFSTIEEAWSTGGWIARQFFVHKEWVKANKDYNSNKSKIRPDVEWKGKDPEETQETAEKQHDSDDLKYVALWEVFIGPTPKKPDGEYIIYSKTQKMILYEADGMPYEGIGYPIREIAQFIPRNSYYAMAVARRSINPLFEHEWFETQKLRMAQESKELIFVGDSSADETDALMARHESLVITGTNNMKASDVQHISIKNDPTAVQAGSLAALARFEKMWGFSATEARLQGGKIATEMVIDNKIFMAKINDLMIRVWQFIENIAKDLMSINKQKMSAKQQILITRKMNNVWQDQDEATLEGNYSVNIKGKPLYDMSDGERSAVRQQFMTVGFQLSQDPKYRRRIDILDTFKQWGEELGLSTNEMFSDEEFADQQGEEIALMLTGMPVPVDPEDDDIEHLRVLQEFITIQEQQGDKTFIAEESMQLIQQHAQAHQQQLQIKQGGSAGASFAEQNNPENQTRSAGSASTSGGAVEGRLQETAQAGRS